MNNFNISTSFPFGDKALINNIKNNNYIIYLQPQFFLENGKLSGAEALIRQVHKDGTIINPGEFIFKYEDLGTIHYVDLFTLEASCKLLQQLIENGKYLNISVNFSKITMLEYNIVDKVRDIFLKYNTPPEYITIEVTESEYVVSLDYLLKRITELKALGVSISMDDFGSKLSNLKILSEIDFDEIKIDKSIIQNINNNEKKRNIVKYIAKMFKALNINAIVAEGITTLEEWNIALQCGCNYGQGFYFSTPLPVNEFLKKYNLI